MDVSAQDRKLLIVDDEESLLAVMQQYLSRLGYDVVACRTSAEAWTAFCAEPKQFMLVLADATLSETSGADLLVQMLDLNPNLALLVCSGYPFDLSQLPDAVREHIGFLQKPFTPRMLADAVERLLAYRQSAITQSPG